MKRKTVINTLLAASMALIWLLGMAGCDWRHDEHHDARADHREDAPVVVHEEVRQEARPIVVHEEVRQEVPPAEHPEIHVDVRP